VKPKPKTIGIVGYDGVQALDIVGPGDAFSLAHSFAVAEGLPGYRVVLLGTTRRAFAAESGLMLKPRATLDAAPPLDTVIIPGGRSLRLKEATSRRIAHWLRQRAPQVRRIASVCTGIYGLAPSGLLDGRRVTTHWRYARDLGLRYPKLKVDANALYLKDGGFYTSAGVTAGIDLALALIEEDYGPGVALATAREMVVYLKRSGGQHQYSEPLQLQAEASDHFRDQATWIVNHLGGDLSVEALAARAHVSPRHFNRLFKEAFGAAPAAYIASVRLGEARRRLSQDHASLKSVAASVGFGSVDSFRRSFERHFGIAPSVYRGRFAARARQAPTGGTRSRL